MVAVDLLTAQFRDERDGAAPRDVDGCHPNCDCERFVELWNLVFMQYYQDPERNRTPLPAPSVDTGMGLERAAVILQGKNNIYETDLFTSIIDRTCRLTGREYGADPESDFALRVIAEHARAAAFLIGDGVVPGNEGRGYVLRRVIRRAIRYGRRLGLTGLFLGEVVEEVIPRFQAVYGELSQNRDFILRVINLEEERFAEAFGRGNDILLDMIGAAGSAGNGTSHAGTISGRDTFVLYDTYGFPPELTAEIAREHNFDVDLDAFEEEMERQREQSRAGQQFEGSMEMLTAYENLGAGRTEFTGHGLIDQESVVAALLVDGASSGHATQGQQAEVVISRTPFYAEGGGQLGDQGYILGPNGLRERCPQDGLVPKPQRHPHSARGPAGHAGAARPASGSLVAPERLRFDFSHVGRMSHDELLAVQSLANEKVRANLLVSAQETSYADAVRQGALAFFGDRYGDVVRVVKMAEDSADPFSFEVCGGTHVSATGQVGTLLVLGESSIGGGMRRVEALTGRAAETLFVEQSATLDALSTRLQTPVADLEARLDSYMQETDDLRRRLAALERSLLRSEAEALLRRVADVDGVRVVSGRTSAHNADGMREMGDFLRDKLSSCVVTLGALSEGSPILVTMVTPDLVERGLNAGNIARDAAKLMGGGGGGRPEMAQAGGRQPEKLDDALAAVPGLVRAALS
ncbi:Alanine--tRNA ligase [Geodia barretti]|uniref:Alanine--tRNA ligase n=1 Tax=Geodia barretti TaxID=519541 RepID=A0AA35T401_GEOBA|nr:Alanine--tRNA ligase [Geodia barretti]